MTDEPLAGKLAAQALGHPSGAVTPIYPVHEPAANDGTDRDGLETNRRTVILMIEGAGYHADRRLSLEFARITRH